MIKDGGKIDKMVICQLVIFVLLSVSTESICNSLSFESTTRISFTNLSCFIRDWSCLYSVLGYFLTMPKAGSSAVRGICSACERDLAIRSDGKVKIHGPVRN